MRRCDQTIGLGQYEEPAAFLGFNLRQFPAEVLREDLVQPSLGVHRFLADDLKTFVQRAQDLVGDEDPCIQGFLDFGILRNLRKFLKDFSSSAPRLGGGR